MEIMAASQFFRQWVYNPYAVPGQGLALACIAHPEPPDATHRTLMRLASVPQTVAAFCPDFEICGVRMFLENFASDATNQNHPPNVSDSGLARGHLVNSSGGF